MGLDMYLWGEKFYTRSAQERPKEDGEELAYKTFQLAYWRKHPDLHGFIVEAFAGGIDNCQKIEIYGDQFDELIAAIRNRKLPHTEGFFFGSSSNDAKQSADTIAQFEKAKKWADVEEAGVWRSVHYTASW